MVRRAIVEACRHAFYYKDDVRALFLAAGTPEHLWSRHSGDDISKAKTTRMVLSELAALGATGSKIQVRVADELCMMTGPDPNSADPKTGKAALDALREEVARAKLRSDPEADAAAVRRTAAEQRAKAAAARKEALRAVNERFLKMLPEPQSAADRQRRGYDFERLLVDMFSIADITYRPPYRAEHEQIDGSFHFRGFTYLVEAKWRKEAPDFGDLAKFKANVDGKLESTRGLFVSMAGYDTNVLEHLLSVARGSRNNLVLVDGYDLTSMLEGRISVADGLIEKIDAAEQRGVFWHPLFR